MVASPFNTNELLEVFYVRKEKCCIGFARNRNERKEIKSLNIRTMYSATLLFPFESISIRLIQAEKFHSNLIL